MKYIDTQHHFLPVLSKCLLLLGCGRDMTFDETVERHVHSDAMFVGKNCK